MNCELIPNKPLNKSAIDITKNNEYVRPKYGLRFLIIIKKEIIIVELKTIVKTVIEILAKISMNRYKLNSFGLMFSITVELINIMIKQEKKGNIFL